MPSLFLVAIACTRAPHAPPERSKVAVVEFSVAPNAKIENFRGDPTSIGLPLAQAAAEMIRAHDTLEAQAISKADAAEGPHRPR
jgi:hypothetical protein